MAKILSKAKSPARKQIRGRILDLIARKEHPATIAETLPVGIATVYNLQKRCLEEGFESALEDKPWSGKPQVITGE